MVAQITVDTTSQTFAGNPQPHPEICLLHTTEVWGWPAYGGGGTAPHQTIRPLPGVGIQVRVHRPWTDYAKSLANRPGGVETNHRGVLQVELMGTCDPDHADDLYYWPDADDVVLTALADHLRPVLAEFDIPPEMIADFVAYPDSYGFDAPQRLSFAQWNSARGICGHQHAPENDHGDPGAFPIARFINHLTQEDDPMAGIDLDAWARKIARLTVFHTNVNLIGRKDTASLATMARVTYDRVTDKIPGRLDQQDARIAELAKAIAEQSQGQTLTSEDVLGRIDAAAQRVAEARLANPQVTFAPDEVALDPEGDA